MRKGIAPRLLAGFLVVCLFLASGPAYARPGKGGGQGKSALASSIGNGVNGSKTERAMIKSGEAIHTQQTKREQVRIREEIRAKLMNSESIGDYQDTKAHWAASDIKKVRNLGLISGYPDGSFKPDSGLTNAEAAALAVRLAEALGTAEGQNSTAIATDEATTGGETITQVATDGQTDTTPAVPADSPDWAKASLSRAALMKIINVNRFHSRVQATRAEAAVMLAKAMGLAPVEAAALPFSDTGYLSVEEIGYLAALVNAGILKGSPDGKFNPNSSITRAEIASLMARIVEKESETGAGNDAADTTTYADGASATEASGTSSDNTAISGTGSKSGSSTANAAAGGETAVEASSGQETTGVTP